MAIVMSKQMIIERIQKHLADGFPGQDFNVTENEILLLIDAAIPFVMKSQIFENYKVSGVFEVPDAYMVAYNITITSQDINTYEWWVTLPQPPLALPTGYDVGNVFITDPATGRSLNGYPIKTSRQGYRDQMPAPTGLFYRVQGDKMLLKATENVPLNGLNLTVEMPISRTADKNATLHIPDDAIDPLFKAAIATILQRYSIPQDAVLDNLPAGTKTS